MALVGLPGRPKTSCRPRTPKKTGLPGLMRTCQKTGLTPAATELIFDQVVIADRDAAREDEDVGALGPGELRRERGVPVAGDAQVERDGARPRRPWRSGPGRWSCGSGRGRFFRPGSTISSPVAMTASFGRRVTGTRARPTAASMPDFGRADDRAPLEDELALLRGPRRPARCCRPAGPRAGRGPQPPRVSVSSTMTTASAPLGRGAPVMMRTAWSGTDGPARETAGGQVLEDLELDAVRGFGAGRPRVRGPDRVAVHRRFGEGRDVLAGAGCPGPGSGPERRPAGQVSAARVLRGGEDQGSGVLVFDHEGFPGSAVRSPTILTEPGSNVSRTSREREMRPASTSADGEGEPGRRGRRSPGRGPCRRPSSPAGSPGPGRRSGRPDGRGARPRLRRHGSPPGR